MRKRTLGGKSGAAGTDRKVCKMKQVGERQLLYDAVYRWYLKKAKLRETGSRMVVTRTWGLGKWGDASQRVHPPSYEE